MMVTLDFILARQRTRHLTEGPRDRRQRAAPLPTRASRGEGEAPDAAKRDSVARVVHPADSYVCMIRPGPVQTVTFKHPSILASPSIPRQKHLHFRRDGRII